MSGSGKITSFFLHEEHEYYADDDESSGLPWRPVAVSFCGKHCLFVHVTQTVCATHTYL